MACRDALARATCVATSHFLLNVRPATPFLNLIGIGSVPVAAEGTAEPLVGAPIDE